MTLLSSVELKLNDVCISYFLFLNVKEDTSVSLTMLAACGGD